MFYKVLLCFSGCPAPPWESREVQWGDWVNFKPVGPIWTACWMFR
jgi:hypothetical protein